MTRRREFQERFTNPTSASSRYRSSRQSNDTVRPMKRDESVESARAGLLRDFEPSDYYVGTTYDSASVNNNYGGGYQAADFYDLNNDEPRNLSLSNTSRQSGPPRRIFDDV